MRRPPVFNHLCCRNRTACLFSPWPSLHSCCSAFSGFVTTGRKRFWDLLTSMRRNKNQCSPLRTNPPTSARFIITTQNRRRESRSAQLLAIHPAETTSPDAAIVVKVLEEERAQLGEARACAAWPPGSAER